MNVRSLPFLSAAVLLGVILFARGLASQGAAQPSPLTLLAKEGRRIIPVSLVNDQEFVALDDLAAIFQLTVREESLALTVSYKGKTIILTPDQALASVAVLVVVVNATVTAPALAGPGVTQVTEVALLTVMEVAATPPKVTAVVLARLVPVIVTEVPPATAPKSGASEVMVGTPSR